MRAPTRPTQTQRAAYERLWRRAEEIRSLCGLPPLAGRGPGAPDGRAPLSLEPLIETLLRDLEGNFRRELATRVQLEGLGEFMAFAARGAEPGRSYRTLVTYLARALDEPHLWLGVVDRSPPAFTLYRPGEIAAERADVPLPRLEPEWLRWITLGEGSSPLPVGPTGSPEGGPWLAIPVRGELSQDRFSGEMPICPGAVPGGSCAVSRQPLQESSGGHRTCASCEFRRVVGLLGVRGRESKGPRPALEAIVPSLGAVLANLGLQESLDFEARFRDEVIESLPLGVVAVDSIGHVITWNRAAEEIAGITREEARARILARPPPERSWQTVLLRSLDQGNEAIREEQALLRPDGSSVPVEVSASPLRDSKGRVRGALATLIDVSSLRSMEERIRQLDRLAALGRFASSVAHELRNPLTGIATGVQYLSRGFAEGDERRESVAFILREVVRLDTIVQDLFTASRPRGLVLAPVALAVVAGRALRGLQPAPEEAGVRIELEGADTWPTVVADADQLQQVLLNLIQNGVQAAASGGWVRVRARAEGSGVAIEVEDSGPGIAPDHLPRIFDPFYTTRPQGTGLGLFVAHGIVQRHRGSIEVDSTAGKGSRFRILLPGAPA